MRLISERCAPLDVSAGRGIKRGGQAFLVRDHVAGPGLAPLRLIRRAQGEGQRSQSGREDERAMIEHAS